MKKIFTLFFLFAFGWAQLNAQIPQSSPIPVVFRIEAQDGFSRVFNYLGAADWCDTLIQTVSGELSWAYGEDDTGAQTDTLLCDSIAHTDLTGKIALIRRGDCEFGWKGFRAQQAGAIGAIIVNNLYDADGGGLVSMGGGDYGAQVQIPVIFMTRDDCESILNRLDNGIEVTATFEVRPFGGPVYAYSYQTPKAGVAPLNDISVNFVNQSPSDPIPDLEIMVNFTDPNGQSESFSQTFTDLPPLSFNNLEFDQSYTPTGAVGEYAVKFSNSLTPDVLAGSFFVTDYTYAQDNGVVDTTTTGGQFNGTLEPDSASYVGEALFEYDFGNFYRTGAQEVTATHVTFILGSYNELWTGDPDADIFKIRIYDADPDGNGEVPDAETYDGLNENTGTNPPIGGADYYLDGLTPNFTVTTVELDDPIKLHSNGIFLAMVQYNGLSAGIGIPPKPALGIGTNSNVAGGLSSARYGDRFYREGWGANNDKFIVRLHLEGYLSGTEEPLSQDAISLSPNPASDVIRLKFDLEKPAVEATVRIIDFNGRLLRTERFENVQRGTHAISLKDLANGAYFLTVVTPEGFRTKKFQVIR